MKRYILTYVLILLASVFLYGQGEVQMAQKHQGINKFVLKEVLQTKNYTYLLAEEGENLQWLAVPKMEAVVGEEYFYKGGMEMVDFKSTELDTTFASVMFLGGVMSKENFDKQNKEKEVVVPPGAAEAETPKEETNITPLVGGVTVKELFWNPDKYAGKTIMIKGKVTKFSDSIMGRNWIHLQDGTDHEGKFDLVATTDETVEVGSVVVLEGTITINKDFGYGYFYDVIMEETVVIAK